MKITQVKDRITEVASTYMPTTYSEKKSDTEGGSATKVTVVKCSAGSDESIESKSEKHVESEGASFGSKSEKETEELESSVKDELKKRYV